MQVWFADATVMRFLEQAARYQCADTPAAQPRKDRDATDLTRRIKSPGANWFTVQPHQGVNADRIVVVPLVGFGDFLLADEDFASNLRRTA
jgi:hypothetical protein